MSYGWLALVALVFTTPASAEMPQGDLTSQWASIRLLAEGRGEGVSEAGLVIIRVQYERAQSEILEAAFKELNDVCDRPDAFRAGGQEGLIKFLERTDKMQEDRTLQAIERIYENLSNEDKKALDSIIEEDRKGISRIGPSVVESARAGQLTVEDVIRRTCMPEKPKPATGR